MSILNIINKLAKRKKGKGVKFNYLSHVIRGFKAVPENGKRFKKNEKLEYAEIRFLAPYENALDAIRGVQAKESVGIILWLDAKEFSELYDQLPKKSEE